VYTFICNNFEGKTKRERTGQKIGENLKINALEGKLANNRIRWCGCILKMNEERNLQKVLNMNVKGKP
jgi:hypothetical protein